MARRGATRQESAVRWSNSSSFVAGPRGNDDDGDERRATERSASSRSRAIYRTKKAVVRARCTGLLGRRAPRFAVMFSELRPAASVRRAYSLSSSSFLFLRLARSSLAHCGQLLLGERHFRQSSSPFAFRKGVLGPIISRKYHYGYNTAPAAASLSRSSAYTDGPYECRAGEGKERERGAGRGGVVAEERHKGTRVVLARRSENFNAVR